MIVKTKQKKSFMSPAEAKEFGIIDRILEHPPKHKQQAGSRNDPEKSAADEEKSI